MVRAYANDNRSHGHYGMQPMQLSLGKCKACGTSNPTIPGEGLAEKCSGCGSALSDPSPMPPPDELVFTSLTEMKANGRTKAARRRAARMRGRTVKRIRSVSGDLGGMDAPAGPGYKGRDCKRVRKHG